jgi:hypothetical protein
VGISLVVRGDRLRQGRRFDARQELDLALLAVSKLVTDLTEQCAVIGDLHHAIDAEAMARADEYAELGEIVAGLKPPRAARKKRSFSIRAARCCRTSPRRPPSTGGRSRVARARLFHSMPDFQRKIPCFTI